MRSGVEFLIAEVKDLLRRDPPYTEKFVLRTFMALRQCLNIIETHETSRDAMVSEIMRLERSMKLGRPRQVDRNKAIAHAHKHGATCSELARRYHVSKQRIHAIVTTAKKRGLY